MMDSSIESYLQYPFDEAVDHRRNEYHANFVKPELVMDRLTAQSYRPEVVLAIVDLKTRHKCLKLKDVASKKIRQGLTPEYGIDGSICLKLKNVQHILVEPDSTTRVSLSFAQKNSSSIISQEAVFINRSGGFTVGRSGVCIPELPIFVSDDVFAFSPNDHIDACFVGCFLNSWWGKRALEAGINGSTGQLKLPLGHIESLPIPMFPMEIQRAVGDKVRKVAKLRLLAAMARSAANEMLTEFMQFQGVDAASNRPTWSSVVSRHGRLDAEYYQPQYVALDGFLAKLPSTIERVDTIEQLICDGAYGVLPPSEFYGNGDLRFLRAQDIGEYLVDGRHPILVPREFANSKAIANEGELLLEVKGGIEGVAICPKDLAGSLVNGSLYRASIRDTIHPYYLAGVLATPFCKLQKKRAAANSIISYLSADFLKALIVPRIGSEAESKIGDHIERFCSLTYQSRHLISECKLNIESLIAGTIDESSLLRDGVETSNWLNAHLHLPVQQSQK